MHKKPRKPNPKKDKEARRSRNPLYWNTGGRRHYRGIDCRDCRRLVRKTQDINQKCDMRKEHEKPETTPKNADAK